MPFAAVRAAARGVSTEPMPRLDWLQAVYDKGAFPRPGEILMIGGMSGSQKSTLAMYIAKSYDDMGLKGMYFTPDMPIDMAISRFAALRTNEKPTEVYDLMHDPVHSHRYQNALAGSNLAFVREPRPNLQDIWDETHAFVEVHGYYPRFGVFDSLTNIDTGSNAGEYSGQEEAIIELDTWARETGALTIVIHHTQNKDQGKPYDVRYPQPIFAIKNQLDARPRLIWTVGFDERNGDFRIAIVKNSHGKSWKNAEPEGTAILTAYPEYAQFQQRVVTW